MAYNGSGSFSLAAGNPVVTGTTISSTWANNTLSDIATGLSTAVCKDGQTTITANLPMGGFKHTGVAVASATTDYARYDQVQNGAPSVLASVAGTNTITGAATPTPAAYVAGQVFRFVPANTNTGATTLNVSSVGAGAVKIGGAACVGGEIRQGIPVEVFVTTSTPVFEIIGPYVGGNLPGGQIKFPASQVTSSDANTLDDYEEGTWTPVLNFGGATTGITYTTQAGTYTKIGNRVFISLNVTLSNKGSATGSATITGLPFTNATAVGFATFLDNVAAGVVTQTLGQVGSSSSTIGLFQYAAGVQSAMQDTGFNNNSTVQATFSYAV